MNWNILHKKSDSDILLLKGVTSDLLQALVTESSANQILTFNDSYVPSATPSGRQSL